MGSCERINSLHLDLYQNVSGKMFSLTLNQQQMYKQDLKCSKSKNKLIFGWLTQSRSVSVVLKVCSSFSFSFCYHNSIDLWINFNDQIKICYENGHLFANAKVCCKNRILQKKSRIDWILLKDDQNKSEECKLTRP